MDEQATSPNDSNNTSRHSNPANLDLMEQEIEETRTEYNKALRQVREATSDFNKADEKFGELVSAEGKLKKEEEVLKQTVKEAQERLKIIRQEIPQIEDNLHQAYLAHRSAQNRKEEAKEYLAEVEVKLQDLEAAYQEAGGLLSPNEEAVIPNIIRNNPWLSGSFYLFTTVVLLTLLAVISTNIPWYALIVVVIGGLLTVAIIGALQLRNDESLSEDNFVLLMMEALKRLPLLQGNDKSEISSDTRGEPLG